MYTADPENDGTFDLYSQTLGGSAVRLNAPLASGNAINEFEVTNNSQYVVYAVHTANPNLDVLNLFSVPIAGGAAVTLNQLRVRDFQLSADGTRVVSTNFGNELRTVSVTGGSDTLLDSDNSLETFAISPDGRCVVYAFDDKLYSIPTVGGLKNQLADNIVRLRFLQISPDSQFVVFLDDYFGNQMPDLYQSPITGGEPVQLNGTTPVTSLFTWLGSYRFIKISADSKYVAFMGDEEMGRVDTFAIYSAPVTGGSAIKVTDTLASGGNDGAYYYGNGFEISQDSQRIIYAADHDTDNVFELFSVPVEEPRKN